MIVNLPVVKPRDYQKNPRRAFLLEKKKRILMTWHRRAGKDTTALSMLAEAAIQKVGVYFYLFPQQNQVRKAIWDNIGKDGNRFLDSIPKSLIEKDNNAEMRRRLRNGSIIQMTGSDNYNALMGTNPIGIVLSEYSLQDPFAWNYLRPILAENGGWAIFTQTPRGKNHGYDLYKATEDDPEWYNELLTVNDTRDINGNPIVSLSNIDQDRKEGMPEELIQQEYYCDFDAALANAFYSEELRVARAEGRIRDFEIYYQYPVHTFWDIGVSDYTAIWFMQHVEGEYRFIYYYQNNRKGVDFYLDMISEIANKHKFQLARQHWYPHDMMKQDFSTGNSAYGIASKRNLTLSVVPATSIILGIAKCRQLFPKCHFHETNCAEGLEALKSYHSDWVEKDKDFKKQPVHDWSSHGADAFRTFGNGWKDNYTESDFYKTKVIQSRSWMERLGY